MIDRVVVDASFCGALILEDETSPEADVLLAEALRPQGPRLLAPDLWTYEMVNLIRSAQKRKRLTRKQASKAVLLLNRIPIAFTPVTSSEVRKRVHQISVQYDLSAYDASYFELADRLNVELRTNDRELSRAFNRR